MLVVGLGDAAMEAAIALAHQPSTKVTIAYRGPTFRRGRARNISEIEALVRRGRIDIRWETEVVRIRKGEVTLRTRGAEQALATDSVLALLGGVPSSDLLVQAQVQIGVLPRTSGEEGRKEDL